MLLDLDGGTSVCAGGVDFSRKEEQVDVWWECVKKLGFISKIENLFFVFLIISATAFLFCFVLLSLYYDY